MDFLAMAQVLEAQAHALRRHAAAQPEPPPAAPEPNPWNDWLGGDAPPREARGKHVDIVFGNGCEERSVPADAYDWSHVDPDDIHFHEIKRYRIADEQPDT